VRLRVGVLLWILSWIPFAALVHASGPQRAVIWTVQVVIGLLGLAVAGSVFAGTVKEVGWRHAPGVAWRSLLHGDATG